MIRFRLIFTLPDSPLTVHCTGPSGGAVKQEIEKRIEQVRVVCSLIIK